MSTLPIACTLDAANLAAVKVRYQEATGLYRATARVTSDRADVHLEGDKPPIRELLDEMIARESSCCSFLAFDAAEAKDGYRVQIRIEDGNELGAAILRDAVETFFPTAMVTTG